MCCTAARHRRTRRSSGSAGALVGAAVLQSVAVDGRLGRAWRPVGDSAVARCSTRSGGLIVGGRLGLVVVWVLRGAVLLPGCRASRSCASEVQQSPILQRLNQFAPPRTVLRAFNRVDPFPAITGPAPPTEPPDSRALASAAVRRARQSVVRITANACGLGVEGCGWVAHAAHRRHGSTRRRRCVLDSRRRAPGEGARRRPQAGHRGSPRAGADGGGVAARDPHTGDSVAHPRLPGERAVRRAARAGSASTADVLVNGSLREVTALSGLVRHGNSGGPAVNAAGRGRGDVFAARIGARAGYRHPGRAGRAGISAARGAPVSTGNC